VTDSELITYLHQALDTKWGLKLEVSDVEAFKRRFYKVRKHCITHDGVEDFETLSLKVSPTHPETQVWIINNVTESRTPPGETNP
jgi:hypothetical protein